MKTYGDYLSSIFPGIKVQKISVDAGFTCPNRDGTIGSGGCIYCRNDSFSPSYCNSAESITKQLEKGKKFFSKKYPEMKYLAYFQSYTGTYNKSIEELSKLYREALEVDDVIGLVIATRPDCISGNILDLLDSINKKFPVFIEIGAETAHDHTLALINRNHTWSQVIKTVNLINQHHLHCGIHLIAGLPGENREMILETIKEVSKLSVETIKLHQLQVLKDTILYHKLKTNELKIIDFSIEEYLKLCVDILKIIPNHIIVERFISQSPPDMIVSPLWGLKNYEFMSKLANMLKS